VGGKAEYTNIAGGMSGSPVYYEGKLLGAISLRFGAFMKEPIAGITPIELMLEIDELDRSRPLAARARSDDAQGVWSGDQLAQQVWNNIGREAVAAGGSTWTPIETPLSLSGAPESLLETFGGHLRSQGYSVVQAGAGAAAELEIGDPNGALNPGEPIAAVLMSGDMSATALGTVSYNDGRRVLGFGHAMFNSGPIEAPIATGDVLTVLPSELAPVKIANAGSIVGALRQDRHSGILGVLGDTAELVPVDVRVRSLGENDAVLTEKSYHYRIFQNQKLTAQLLMMALYNSMFGVNDFAEESTFRIQARVNFEGADELDIRALNAVSDGPIPAPLQAAAAVASRLQLVYLNTREMPRMQAVDVTIELLPERRVALIDQVWVDRRRAKPGDEIRGKVILQPFRGERFEEDFLIQVPESAPKGRLTLTVSDAALLNQKRQMAAMRNPSMTLPQTVSLLNQELRSDRIYVSLADRSPTGRFGDSAFPALPASTLNVMRDAVQGRMTLEMQSPLAETSIPLNAIASGARTVAITVE
jgi:hypothetical protein